MNQMTRAFSPAAGSGTLVADGAQHVGLIRIGPAMIAINVIYIREVIPAPAIMFTPAIVAQGLVGMIELRGTVIPVADLRSTLGLPQSTTVGQVILVLRVDGRLLGLQADEVCGIAVASLDELHQLTIAGSQLLHSLATHSFRWANTVVTLLSARTIIELPGMPSVQEKAAISGLQQLANAEPVLLFSIDQLHFGVAANVVEATAPNAAILDSPLKSDICVGIIDHHGIHVPVVDTLMILGLGCRSAATHSSVLILRYGDGNLLGFLLDNVCDIPRLQKQAILPMPALMSNRTNLFSGIYNDPRDRQFLILDSDNMKLHEDLSALAKLSRQHGRGVNDQEGVRSSHLDYQPHLIYRAGADLASPLSQIREIVDFPERFTPVSRGADGMLGLFTHRGAAIPLVSLSTCLGLRNADDRSNARVLLVPDGDQIIGVVVESLKSIESARTREIKGVLDNPVSGRSNFIGHALVELQVDGQASVLPQIDLPSFCSGGGRLIGR